MNARTILMGLLVLAGSSIGCDLTTGDPPACPPTTTVVLDAGVDGMPEVGQYASTQMCIEICGPTTSSCCRAKNLVFECWQGQCI